MPPRTVEVVDAARRLKDMGTEPSKAGFTIGLDVACTRRTVLQGVTIQKRPTFIRPRSEAPVMAGAWATHEGVEPMVGGASTHDGRANIDGKDTPAEFDPET